jgi:hypothetical protein
MDKNEFLIDLSESSQTQFGKFDFTKQSLPQKVFSAIWSLEGEVNNGGFQFFFLNSSAERAPFIAEALYTIGAKHTAEMWIRVTEIAFPEGLPSNADEISSKAKNFDGEQLADLDELDQDFYARSEDMTELLFAYVMSHKDVFGIS